VTLLVQGGAVLAVLVVASLLAFAGPAPAHADVTSQCCAAKLRAAGPRERLLFRCHARAFARGTAVDASCMAAVAASLDRGFARADTAAGCPATDAAQVEADLERIVATVAAMLRPQPTKSACTARKLKVAGRRVLLPAGRGGMHGRRPVLRRHLHRRRLRLTTAARASRASRPA